MPINFLNLSHEVDVRIAWNVLEEEGADVVTVTHAVATEFCIWFRLAAESDAHSTAQKIFAAILARKERKKEGE